MQRGLRRREEHSHAFERAHSTATLQHPTVPKPSHTDFLAHSDQTHCHKPHTTRNRIQPLQAANVNRGPGTRTCAYTQPTMPAPNPQARRLPRTQNPIPILSSHTHAGHRSAPQREGRWLFPAAVPELRSPKVYLGATAAREHYNHGCLTRSLAWCLKRRIGQRTWDTVVLLTYSIVQACRECSRGAAHSALQMVPMTTMVPMATVGAQVCRCCCGVTLNC